MRMTNKIMQNNSLYNINNNKLLEDKLSTMMSTHKKITRPSDDPVIAIRALRLRTSVAELTQYYEKNAPDAESWLEVTEGALKTVTDVLTEMSKQANKAANKDLEPSELEIIIGQLKALRDEVYSTGNTDYAGRYIFTGYRTDTTLSFEDDVNDQPKGYPRYEITEQVKIEDFDTINYTDRDVLNGITKDNYKDSAYNGAIEQGILNDENSNIHRLRLSYDGISADGVMEKSKITLPAGTQIKHGDGKVETLSANTDVTLIAGTKAELNNGTLTLSEGTSITLDDGSTVTLEAAANVTMPAGAEIVNANGEPEIATNTTTGTVTLTGFTQTQQFMGETVNTVSVTNDPDPYKQIYEANKKGDNLVIMIPETGEILFSNEAYKEIEKKAQTQPEMAITYRKDSWEKGDLRPEHYFACTGTTKSKDGTDKTINYNQEYLRGEGKKQVIEYDVGYNQKIQINTTADEVFGHAIDRDIDDLENALEELKEIEAIRNELDGVLKGLDEEKDADYEVALKRYEAADKAYSYIRENIHNMFGKTITKMQEHLDDTNVALTDNGTRNQRLDLISNRLMDQRTTFKTLQSENEDIDIAEVVVKLTSAELTYNSALMATGKIMQTSLMNYI
ncbi:flagellin N-terminal helical domain-containing protein [Parablautia muri]|uniref:Flagellin N-terminal domain-containing protein n=1 Tax=Parablautia muri TaxID=2320879 RepID=A0A9X5GRV2_9FIRM|nr:hypothetical protein [Parablautia muri]NBJ92561.1 hypothetical protein [Parablautia muri]